MKYNKELKQLEKLIKLLKENKIKEYKSENIQLTFDSGAFIDPPAKKVPQQQNYETYYGYQQFGEEMNVY